MSVHVCVSAQHDGEARLAHLSRVNNVVSSGSTEFDRLRQTLIDNDGLRKELEWALVANVNRVNPADRANRFGSGAAVEWILASAAFYVGILALPGGHNTDGFDLRDLRKTAQGLWSVKNTTKRSDFRITNGMGGSGRGFIEPLVMLSPALPGLTFANPELHVELAGHCRVTGDATILPFRAVLLHAQEHPECVAVCKMPENEGEGQDDPWMDYVNSLLDSVQFPLLSKMFKEARGAKNSVVKELERLVDLRDAGIINADQFNSLVNRI